jgi:hypothetical protein
LNKTKHSQTVKIHAPIVFEDSERTGPTKFKAELDKLAVKIKQERKEARENAALEQEQLDTVVILGGK